MNCVRGLVLVCFTMLAAGAVAQEPSLGDLARQQRATRKPAARKVITNDDLDTRPPADKSAATPAANAPADEEKAAATAPKKDAKADAESAPGERDKNFGALYKDRKSRLDLLQRELAVAEREYRLQTAAYYVDAGSRLRDDKNWAEARRKSEAEIAAKRKQVQDMEQEMEGLREQARREGVSPRVFEQ